MLDTKQQDLFKNHTQEKLTSEKIGYQLEIASPKSEVQNVENRSVKSETIITNDLIIEPSFEANECFIMQR